MTNPSLSIVTVVYSKELPLLRLQARSIRRHFHKIEIEKIIICVNELYSLETIEMIGLMAEEYGELYEKVEIWTGDALFARPNELRSPMFRFRELIARRMSKMLRPRSGWQANDGWNIQQAFKLAVARHLTTRHLLILDAKNIFVGEVEISDFVDQDGKPKARFTGPNKFTARWFRASASAIGCFPGVDPVLFTHFTTPFCVDRGYCLAVLGALEERGVPIEYLFSRPWNRATEFMLINAWLFKSRVTLEDAFSDGIIRSYTIFGGMNRELAIRILQEALANEAKCIGVHSRVLDDLAALGGGLVFRLLLAGGVVDSISEAEHIFSDAGLPTRKSW